MGAEEKKLTQKQKLFCQFYIEEWNASDSARRAGYSKKTAGSIGGENLQKPEIQAYIKEIQLDLGKLSGLSKLKVLNEHKKIAFSAISNLHKTWIDLKEFEDIPQEYKDSIKKIDRKVTYKPMYDEETDSMKEYMVEQVKIELHDKLRSLESISKMLGYNEAEKVDLTSKGKELENLTSLERMAKISQLQGAMSVTNS
jgi:phage terminase small subunit